ncbi:acyltransferase [Priestia aryabhattai]|uniref:acyltransferase n=1 Tax=Priestia aryabhattai TaxID=412384 RepID=UPI002E20DB79|nr:acyltransferase [Priestia aryabhattai]
MFLIRAHRKIRGVFKSIIYKIIYIKSIKGPMFSIGKSGEILIIGSSSVLKFGKDNVIRNNVSLRLTGGKLILGDNVFINDNCCLVSRKRITIGNNCLIGQNVCIYDNNHNFKGDLPISAQGFSVSQVDIGDNVWVGSNVVILPGVRIGHNVVIGAGAIVKKDIPDNSVFYNKVDGVIKNMERNIK